MGYCELAVVIVATAQIVGLIEMAPKIDLRDQNKPGKVMAWIPLFSPYFQI